MLSKRPPNSAQRIGKRKEGHSEDFAKAIYLVIYFLGNKQKMKTHGMTAHGLLQGSVLIVILKAQNSSRPVGSGP